LRTGDVQRTDLRSYALCVVATTLLLVALPLAAAYKLSRAPFELGLPATTLICTLASIGLGRIGAALWQRHRGSRDIVFDDLLPWGFARRLLNERRVIKNAERLARGLTREDQLNALMRLAKALEAGDPYTHGHSNRVARHAYMIARSMKLSRSDRELIRLAGALHDVGKLRTPREVLTKPTRLTDEEFEIIKRHPRDGAEMVAALDDDELTAMVRHHHERKDGSGYPNKLSGAAIPVGARIISVADTFDAITSKRPYRPSRKHKEAIDILVKEAGTRLDAGVVKAFIAYYTGRRGIRLWLSVTSSLPRLFDTAAGTTRRVVANAAVVGSATAVVVGGAAVLGGPDVTRPVVTSAPNEASAGASTEGDSGFGPGSEPEEIGGPRDGDSDGGPADGGGSNAVGSGSESDLGDGSAEAGVVAAGDDAGSPADEVPSDEPAPAPPAGEAPADEPTPPPPVDEVPADEPTPPPPGEDPGDDPDSGGGGLLGALIDLLLP